MTTLLYIVTSSRYDFVILCVKSVLRSYAGMRSSYEKTRYKDGKLEYSVIVVSTSMQEKKGCEITHNVLRVRTPTLDRSRLKPAIVSFSGTRST